MSSENAASFRSMNSDYEIIVFSDDWNGLPFSCKHLIKHFLPQTPVIWVDTIGLRAPKLNLYDIRRSFQKLAGWLAPRRLTTLPDMPANLRILDPFQLPYNHYTLIRNLNRQSLLRAVHRESGNVRRQRVLLTTWPFLGNMIGSLNEDLSVYYRVDDFSEFPGVQRDHIRMLEEELIHKADMVVGSADNLAEITAFGKTGKYLPHGVDYEHFASPTAGDACRFGIENIPAPRIGFFGLLNSWIDFDLIRDVASSCPEWSFIFIGPSQLPASSLPSLPNLHFLGPLAYSELPVCANLFQVGLIPFRINPLTISVNPLKLMEYFAIGIPVISTPLPEVMKHGSNVYIADTADKFIAAIRKALAENDPAIQNIRQQLARSHGWEAKSTQLRQWIEAALEEKRLTQARQT
jgi:glycosyltransferase involved in cell wall biosynthesis